MKEKIKTICLTGLFYISLFLAVLFFMIIFEPKCVGAIFNECMSEEAYFLVFTPAIYVFIAFIINFMRKRVIIK